MGAPPGILAAASPVPAQAGSVRTHLRRQGPAAGTKSVAREVWFGSASGRNPTPPSPPPAPGRSGGGTDQAPPPPPGLRHKVSSTLRAFGRGGKGARLGAAPLPGRSAAARPFRRRAPRHAEGGAEGGGGGARIGLALSDDVVGGAVRRRADRHRHAA